MVNPMCVYLLLLVSVCGSSAFTVKEMSFAAETDGLHFRSELDTQWLDFIITYNKSYSGEAEMLWRRHVWEENVDTIRKHNEEAVFGAHTYTMGINQFTDMTFSEFSDIYLSSLDNPDSSSEMAQEFDQNMEAPSSVDWRTKNVVTPVKNQGQCGSCWAFSATGAIEGQWALNKGRLVSLSEKNLMDCSSRYGNDGCQGGLPTNAFQYVIRNGIDTESCYPYIPREGICRFRQSCIGATLRDFRRVPPGEGNLRQAVANVGPISVGIFVTPSFQHYDGGIFSDPRCNQGRINHAVLVVGYAPGYWIIKNSWGTAWGLGGYVHLAMGRDDMCHVSQMASFPMV